MEDLKLILKDISHKVDRILDQQNIFKEKNEELLNLHFNGKLDLSYANKNKTKATHHNKNNLSHNNLQI